MTTLLLLAALAVIPRLPVVEDRCEIIDANNVYSPEDGTITLRQCIYLDDHHGIIAWRTTRPGMVPTWDRSRGCYTAVWFDGNVLRRVRCRTVVESFWQSDYELASRAEWPEECRKNLGQLHKGN